MKLDELRSMQAELKEQIREVETDQWKASNSLDGLEKQVADAKIESRRTAKAGEIGKEVLKKAQQELDDTEERILNAQAHQRDLKAALEPIEEEIVQIKLKERFEREAVIRKENAKTFDDHGFKKKQLEIAKAEENTAYQEYSKAFDDLNVHASAGPEKLGMDERLFQQERERLEKIRGKKQEELNVKQRRLRTVESEFKSIDVIVNQKLSVAR
ncbi:hypothetical protein L0244_01530 [bacterium]|nr:hypothetical protein [bacterium]